METGEKRDIDSDTFEHGTDLSDRDCQTGEPFHNVVHVHCPSIYLTNQSRNVSCGSKDWLTVARISILVFLSRSKARGIPHLKRVSPPLYSVCVLTIRSLVTVRADLKKRILRKAKMEAGDLSKDQDRKGAEGHDLLAELTQALGSKSAPDYFRLPVDHEIDHVDLRQPSIGLPAQCKAQGRFRFLMLKPQITFRSEADPDAIILLAVEEYSHKVFKVIDTTAKDDVTKAVLHR